MTDFTKLDPETRSYALVGKFLFEWSCMESEIEEAIRKAMSLDDLQLAIITANVQFRDKINILKTAVHYTGAYQEKERERVKKVLTNIGDYAPTRNMMAHSPFVATNSGSVRFFVTKARGEVKLPKEIWDIGKFEGSYQKIANFAKEAQKIIAHIDRTALAKALFSSEGGMTMGGAPGLGLLGGLSHLLQDNPDSDIGPPIEQTNPQTPPIEKE